MANKYYAVKVGLTPGIYFNWEDCKKQVNGVPGAKYKSFKTLEEANAFINGDGDLETKSTGCKKPAQTEDFSTRTIETAPGQMIAYVDGSYNDANKSASYGAVIFFNNEESHFSGKVLGADLISMRNVAGEIKGAEFAMKHAIECGATSLVIYHDYQGIAKWCTGEWKANLQGTIAYRDYYNSIKNHLNISFEKVKGHSGDTYNELADSLAKSVIF